MTPTTRPKKYLRKYLIAFGLALAALSADNAPVASLLPFSFIPEAQARIGRPLTPLSVAGAARRTTRRVIRRTAVYVATLPAGCAKVNVNGVVLWRCGGAYYQAYGSRYVVVNVY
jgi:hypothetical protein